MSLMWMLSSFDARIDMTSIHTASHFHNNFAATARQTATATTIAERSVHIRVFPGCLRLTAPTIAHRPAAGKSLRS